VHAEPNPTSYIYPTPTGDRTTLPVSSHNSKIVAHDGMAVRAGTGRNLSQCCVPRSLDNWPVTSAEGYSLLTMPLLTNWQPVRRMVIPTPGPVW